LGDRFTSFEYLALLTLTLAALSLAVNRKRKAAT